jgi:hypothetical protein
VPASEHLPPESFDCLDVTPAISLRMKNPIPHGNPRRRSPRLVYVRSFSDLNIWRVETSASGAPPLSPPVASISSTREDNNAQFSPDARRVACRYCEHGFWPEAYSGEAKCGRALKTSLLAEYSDRIDARGAPSWDETRDNGYHTETECRTGERDGIVRPRRAFSPGSA